MSLNEQERSIIEDLELEKARNTFAQVSLMVEGEYWDGAANRLYYATFHAVNALLIHDGHRVNTHRGSHTQFGNLYVRTGIMPPDYGRLYTHLQTLREESDYNCTFSATEEDVRRMLQPAKDFIDAIVDYICNHPILNKDSE